MPWNSKTLIFSFISLVLILLISYNVLSYFNFFRSNTNKTDYSILLTKNNFKSSYTPKIKFSDRPISEINDVSLSILDGTSLPNVPMILKSQRYYIPLNFISEKLNYTVDNSSGLPFLSNNTNKILLTEDSYEKNSKRGSLRGNLLNYNNTFYISISDIEELFDLIAIFNFENKKISLIQDDVKAPKNFSIPYNKKIAMIRFEDFGCGYSNIVDKNQTKIKIMSNLLYFNGMKFHVSWMPRFIVPSANFDNDLLTKDNIINVGFVDVLDYMLNKGGEIGLHGYSHQSGNVASGTGEDMSKDVNSTEAETRAVIEKGIDTASALNIPISYYESPHYRATMYQKKIISDYFQFLYEHYDYSKKDNIYKTDDHHLFVPTPLGRISNPATDTQRIIDKFNEGNPDVLKSFYYHPSTEIEYIDFETNDNKLNINYNPDSPLQRIVKTIKKDKYTPVHIDELMDK
ncbi:DUF2334 domain-containing protein [Clostridium folliculivorans]|uniref:Copper amine oxidase-like N-terminal domain-containing protein n=1 Tax=Clostridium folliculivorans TaxID=2886038 RepID=A0A9W5Y2J6_9CLOT|nr:DUF2334 domain-containing protein [Clostridium folliculivorans]GKU25554.1 hypothetical protein CFOLD11_23800 [Clostridium folliculivorans]GKU28577.1 hypothetical protein CFB3_06830 [Clostridium folliculivorans]